MSALTLIVRALLLGASFAGLCAAIRARFDLDALVAPFTASCAIIAWLMFAGMLGILKIGLCALYLLGFVGLLYAYVRRRAKPRFVLMLAVAAFAALLTYRFHGTHFWTNDDVSHWGLVVNHLIRHDRFPNGGDSYIYFQSYPLGLASFMYYILDPLANTEALQLAAQNFLLGMLFLPVFSMIRRRRRVFYPIAAALYFAFAALSLFQNQLGADLPQAFFGIGAAATIARYRNDFRRAAIATLPMLVAIAYVKNSGLFFGLAAAIMLIWVAKRSGMDRRRLRRCGAALVLLPVAAFLLWELHIKLRFPAALESKHAVSLNSYAEHFRSKGASVIWAIAQRQLRALVELKQAQLLGVPMVLAASAVLLLAMRKRTAPERARTLHAYLFAVALYFAWYLCIFFMYVFSMPTGEALSLASFSRYNGAGLVYLAGLISVLMLQALQRKDSLPGGLLWAGSIASWLCAALILGFVLSPGDRNLFGVVTKYDSYYPRTRAEMSELHRQYALPDGEDYLVVFHCDQSQHGERNLYVFYSAKYEFESSGIHILSFNEDELPGQFYTGSPGNFTATDRPMDCVEACIDDLAAILILDESPELEAQIESYMEDCGLDVPICRAEPAADAAA